MEDQRTIIMNVFIIMIISAGNIIVSCLEKIRNKFYIIYERHSV